MGKINMKALEAEGFVHLYGLASCRNALRANRRDLGQVDESRLQELQQQYVIEGEEEEDGNECDDYTSYNSNKETSQQKPEAQFRPWLFLLESSSSSSSRSADKLQMAEEIVALAKRRNVPIARVDRGVLNTLCGNRPHQVSFGRETMIRERQQRKREEEKESSNKLVVSKL
jgi:hypothetical protein